jgi:hypothetical protein
MTMNEALRWCDRLPYGAADFEPDAASKFATPGAVDFVGSDFIRCCIRGCERRLTRRRRGQFNVPSHFCPEHGISVSTSPTYLYHRDLQHQNFIIARSWLHSAEKVERWRLGNENSEDALTWNVFVGCLRVRALRSLFHALTGWEACDEPELYLWGNRISADGPEPWEELYAARKRIEPRPGIPTEPDAALRVRGQALVLVEAKFGSPNGTLKGKHDRFGAVTDFVRAYTSEGAAGGPLHAQWIAQQAPDSVLEQLCRHAVFAHRLATDGEAPFVVNLVRKKDAPDIERRFGPHLLPGSLQFRRVEWEQLYTLPELHTPAGEPLRRYLETKSFRLAKAFDLSSPPIK